MTDLKPSTRRSMESSIRAHLIPVLGDTSLSKIDTRKAQDLINSTMKNARGKDLDAKVEALLASAAGLRSKRKR